MPRNSLFLLLLRKADQDRYMLDKLVADDAAPIEVFGFHAQQATEKLIKAVLVIHGIEYGRTHRLAELADLAGDHGIQLPDVVEPLVDLTPYAVEFRYDAAPDDECDDLDKPKIRDQIESLRAWVLEHVKEQG